MTEVLSCFVNVKLKLRCWPISGQHWGIAYSAGARVGFPTWGSSILHKFRFKLPICNNHNAYFSVGKIIYCVGNFGQWAGLIYWVGKIIY